LFIGRSKSVSIILANVAVGFFKQLGILVQLEVEKGAAEGFADVALAGGGVLPAGKTHQADNAIDLVDETLDDDARIVLVVDFPVFNRLRDVIPTQYFARGGFKSTINPTTSFSNRSHEYPGGLR